MVVITGGVVSASCASASGTINGIDGGTKSIDTRKIPKKVVKLDVLVMISLSQTIFKFDHHTGMLANNHDSVCDQPLQARNKCKVVN